MKFYLSKDLLIASEKGGKLYLNVYERKCRYVWRVLIFVTENFYPKLNQLWLNPYKLQLRIPIHDGYLLMVNNFFIIIFYNIYLTNENL